MKNLTLIFLLIVSFAWAAQRTDILQKQADRFASQRQFEKAIELYEMILEEDPRNVKIIERLFNVFITTSQLDKADALLQSNFSDFSKEMLIKLQLKLLLRKGEIEEARSKANEFLEDNSQRVNYYPMLANIFEAFRQYDAAIEFLTAAREKTGNNFLYARELAFNYQNINDLENAVLEYLRLVDDQNRYSNYVINRLNQILKEDESVIGIIEQYSKESEDVKVHEIFALALGEIGEFDRALEAYGSLSPAMLLRFANRQKTYENYEIALQAFRKYLEKSIPIYKKADIQITIAEILLQLAKYQEAMDILGNIRDNKELQQRNNRYRTRANVRCRKLMAEISIRTGRNIEQIETFLEEAKTFAFNNKERKMIDLDIVNLYILNKDLDKAKSKLDSVVQNEDQSSDVFKSSFYYSYLIARLENDPARDSLLSECIILTPESDEINDILMLEFIVNSLDDKQERFLDAYMNRKNYRIERAIADLEAIFATTKNEQMLFLAGDWAQQAGLREKAIRYFQHEYENEILTELASLKLAELLEQERTLRSSEFLTAQPNSVFSPLFRRLLDAE